MFAALEELNRWRLGHGVPRRRSRSGRTFSLLSLLATLSLALVLPGALSPAPATAAGGAVNLGYALNPLYYNLYSDDGVTVIPALESSQGKDLNGDGDTGDTVLVVVDGQTGADKPTDFSFYGQTYAHVCHDAGYLSFIALEDGRQDFNNDGDRSDKALVDLEVASGQAYVIPLAAGTHVACDGGWVAFTVSEAGEGQNLNGDNDASDHVWHVYERATGDVNNLKISPQGNTVYTARVGPRGMVLQAYEGYDDRDWNGDGDEDDKVLFVVNYPYPTGVSTGLAGELNVDERFRSTRAYGRFVPFRADEAAQGQDLNGDGDATDMVVHVVDTADGSIEVGPAGYALRSASRWIPVLHQEAAHFGQDENGDGDAVDFVLTFMNGFNGSLWDTGLVVHSNANPGYPFAAPHDFGLGFDGRWVSAEIRESESGLDLNGDGDQLDDLVHRFDPRYQSVVLTDAQSTCLFDDERVLAASRDRALACTRELPWHGGDLNGDNDMDDVVAIVTNLVSGSTRNTELAIDAKDPMIAFKSTGFLVASERDNGRSDFNGDGDTDDAVPFRVDLDTGAVASLGRSVDWSFGSFGEKRVRWSFDGAGFFFGVDEQDEGRDLNGDGDRGDVIVHWQPQ